MKDRQSERWSVSLMEACILPMPPRYKSVKFTSVKTLVLLLKYQTAQNFSKDLCQPCSLHFQRTYASPAPYKQGEDTGPIIKPHTRRMNY